VSKVKSVTGGGARRARAPRFERFQIGTLWVIALTLFNKPIKICTIQRIPRPESRSPGRPSKEPILALHGPRAGFVCLPAGASFVPPLQPVLAEFAREIFLQIFAHVSTMNRVDRTPCFSYTCAVVQSPLGLVVKGKSSSPEQRATERGLEERPKWGASPAKPREASPLYADAVHSSG